MAAAGVARGTTGSQASKSAPDSITTRAVITLVIEAIGITQSPRLSNSGSSEPNRATAALTDANCTLLSSSPLAYTGPMERPPINTAQTNIRLTSSPSMYEGCAGYTNPEIFTPHAPSVSGAF